MLSNIVTYSCILFINLIVIVYLVTRGIKLIKTVVLNEIIKEINIINHIAKKTILKHEDEIKDSSHLVKCQLEHNHSEMKKLGIYNKGIIENLHIISTQTLALKNTVDERVKLEKEIIKLKKIIERNRIK